MRAVAVVRAVVGLLCAALAAEGGLKHAFDRPVFIYMRHPELPLDRFAAGRLGIPEPTWARIYHFVVYRELTGQPLTPAEREAWRTAVDMRGGYWVTDDAWSRPYPTGTGQPYSSPDLADWLEVRARVTTVSAPVPKPPARPATWAYTSRTVCAEDAYAVAAGTLRERIRRYGAPSPEVKFWTEGQDAVFEACADSGVTIPKIAPVTMPALIRADREYQIAAALFNAMRFDEARIWFERIARDRNSPWRVWAPYLVGRAWLWQGRVTQSAAARRQFLVNAERQFLGVLASPGLAVSHEGAERLLVRCLLVTNPKDALTRMGTRLAKARAAISDWEVLLYFNGLDDLELPDPDRWDRRMLPPEKDWPTDALSRWLLTAKDQRPEAAARAAAEWSRTRSAAWLMIAMDRASDASDAQMMATASESKIMGIRFHHARLLALKGEWDAARRTLTEIDAQAAGQRSTRNRILTLRCQLAADEGEFLRLAPRVVIMPGNETDDAEFPHRDHPPQKLASLPWWDETSETILTQRVPLEKLARWVVDSRAPVHLAAELKRVVWTRALLLGRGDVAARFGEARNEVAAARAMLKLPGARPFVSRGYGRDLPAKEFDVWGQNWWYRMTEEEMHAVGWDTWHRDARARLLPRLPFLSEADERQAGTEWAALGKAPRGLAWIGERVIRWAEANPKDTEAPAELIRLVDASIVRFWARSPLLNDEPTVKRARRLIETRYRDTEWHRQLQNMYPYK